MPCALRCSTKTPAACAPCARPVTRPRLLSCGEIVPVFRFRYLFQELFHRNLEPVQISYPGALCGCGLLGLVKYRRTWERMGSGGLRGPQNRCEACKTSWMCSIHIRSRHTLPALLCSRSCCVPQRRCFVFAWVCRVVCLVAYGNWSRALGFERADGGVLPYDYRKTGRSFLRRTSGRAVLTHGLR